MNRKPKKKRCETIEKGVWLYLVPDVEVRAETLEMRDRTLLQMIIITLIARESNTRQSARFPQAMLRADKVRKHLLPTFKSYDDHLSKR